METDRTADASRALPPFRRIAAVLLLVCACLMLPGPLFSIHSWNAHWFSPGSVILLAAGVLCCMPDRTLSALRTLPPRLLAPGLILMLTALYHAFRHAFSYSVEDLGFSFLYTVVPFFGLVFRRELLSLLPPFMTAVWLLNFISSLTCALQGRTVAGFTSNINWNAALTFFSGALALYWIFTGPFRKKWKVAAALPVAAGSLWIFFVTGCRALPLAVGLTVPVFLYGKLPEGKPRRLFRLILVLLLLCAAGGGFLAAKNPSVMQRLRTSDRFYFYTTVPEMILRAPCFGYGLPSFEQEYLPYKKADYYLLEHCAVRTNHPHNDLLFLASGCGIAGAVCFLLLLACSLIPFYRHAEKSLRSLPYLLFLLFLILLIHAQLDLIFFHIPLCFFALLIPGILAGNDEMPPHLSPVRPFPRIFLRLCGVFFCGTALFAVAVTAAESELLRQAQSAPSPEKTQRAFDLLMKLPRMTPRPLYQLLFVSPEWTVRNPDKVLAAVSVIRKTAIPDYAHLNLIEAQALTALGRYAEAERAFLRECAIYPLQVMPLLMLREMYRTAASPEGVGYAEARLREIMRLRGFDEDDVRFIMRHPDYDLHPWRLREDRLRR